MEQVLRRSSVRFSGAGEAWSDLGRAGGNQGCPAPLVVFLELNLVPPETVSPSANVC